MIDNIKVVFYTKHVDHYLKKICFFSKPSESTGDPIYYNRYYGRLSVVLVGNRVTITGSLHKFYHGNNYSSFTRSDIKSAVEKFCKIFLVDGECNDVRISSIEYGVNIETKKQPMSYAACMIAFLRNPFRDCKPKRRTTKIWGRECSTTNFNLKFYDKSIQTILTIKPTIDDKEKILDELPENLLRYEVVHYRTKAMPYLYNLNSLYSLEFLNYLGKDLTNKFDRIEKRNKLDCSLLKLPQIRKYYAGLDAEFWKELTRFPNGKKDERVEFRKIKSTCTKTTGDLTTELRKKLVTVINHLLSS